jgi:hypothetical protein
MADNSLVIVALVGLALVCLGVLFVAFILLLRFAGSRPLGFLSTLLGGKDDDEPATRIVTTPKPDLRSIAAAQDFDAALAKHIVQDEIEPQIVQRAPATPPPTPDQLFGEDPKLARRSDRSTPSQRRDEEDDDMFADFLG